MHWKAGLFALLILATLAGSGIAGGVPAVGDGVEQGVEWRFATGTLGFVATNGVAPLRVVDGALQVRVTGFDPYIHSPRVTLVGERDRFLQIRLRATQGSQIKLYFTTSSGGWSEARSIVFDIVADGAFRDYWVDLSEQPGWRGPITQFRLDLEPPDTLGALVEIEWIRFYQVGPSLLLDGVRLSEGILYPDRPVHVQAQLVNSGGEPLSGLSWRLEASEGLHVEGPLEGPRSRLDLGAVIPLQWTVQARDARPQRLELAVTSDTLGPRRFSIPLPVSSLPPDPGSPQPNLGARTDAEGHVVLEGESFRLTFVRSSFGYAHAVAHGRGTDGWVPLAALPAPTLRVQHAAGQDHAALIPTHAEALTDGSGVALFGNYVDAAGTAWDFRFTYRLAPGSEWVEAAYEVTPDQEAQLLRLEGPQLLVGEQSFGGEKQAALFPGLEWLTAEERSSSTLDAHPPLDLRTVPHPLKVTVPHVAVMAKGYLVGLMWDPLQHWAVDQQMPAARFASPNWLQGQQNHLIGLSVPSVGEWVRENEAVARTPYRVAAGETLRVEAQITLAPASDVLEAIDLYFARYGVPDPGEPPHTWDELRRLMAHAYMESYWIPEAQGWGHVHGWTPQPFPGLNEVLRMLADRESDEALRQAMHDRVRQVTLAGAMQQGPGWLGTSAGGHFALRLLPFFQGYVLPALDAWGQAVRHQMLQQEADGHWGFTPGEAPELQALGTPGERALGLTATPTWDILRYARVTGDKAATASGLKALAAIARIPAPPGGADLGGPRPHAGFVGCSQGDRCVLGGYRVTGDTAYLDDARYWARAGLPFIYMWGPADRPVMPYAALQPLVQPIMYSPGLPGRCSGMAWFTPIICWSWQSSTTPCHGNRLPAAFSLVPCGSSAPRSRPGAAYPTCGS